MTKRTTSSIGSLIGPGFITAALILGPGSLTVASRIGANYEFRLFWVVPLCVLFMAAFTITATRIGLYSEQSLLQQIKQQYGQAVGAIIGVGLFVVAASFQAGNSIGAGMAFGELFHTSPTPWVILFSGLAMALLFFRGFYRFLEKIMISLVLVMLVCFIITLVISKPDLSVLLRQFNFSLPEGSEWLTVALVASSFSVAGAFYQSYLIREKGGRRERRQWHEREALSGILILGIITATVMLVAAAVLFPKGIAVNSAAEMGMTLEPIFGRSASTLFMVGLFAASFSSLIGNATLGGVLLSDTFSLGQKLEFRPVRMMILLVILTGAIIAVSFGRLPIQLIVTAQALTIIVVPLIGLMILLVALKKSRSGEMPLSKVLTAFLALGLVILLVLATFNAYSIFIK